MVYMIMIMIMIMYPINQPAHADGEFNAPNDRMSVISEAVFTANHLTDTDKQNSTEKYAN